VLAPTYAHPSLSGDLSTGYDRRSTSLVRRRVQGGGTPVAPSERDCTARQHYKRPWDRFDCEAVGRRALAVKVGTPMGWAAALGPTLPEDELYLYNDY
jgi:hypothetical protein